jgi:hypothetical protein
MITPAEIANAASDANEYPPYGAKGADAAAKRRAYSARTVEIRDEFAANLAAEYLPGMPATVTDRAFRDAWDQGHDSGFNEVEDRYEEIASFANLVANAVRNA